MKCRYGDCAETPIGVLVVLRYPERADMPFCEKHRPVYEEAREEIDRTPGYSARIVKFEDIERVKAFLRRRKEEAAS